MKLQYDPGVDAAYLQLVEQIVDGEVDRSVEGKLQGSDIVLDYRVDGTLLGIEILDASTIFRREALNNAQES